VSVLLLAAMIFGVELELDKTYNGPEKLTVSSLGVSMGLPFQWSAIAKKGEGVLLFQATTKDTIVLHSKSMNVTDALNYLNVPHYLDKDLKIFPQERIGKINSRIYRRVYSANGDGRSDANILYVILGPQERAVVMQAHYDAAHENTVMTITLYIAQTLSFTPTKQLRNALDDLDMRLKGGHFVYSKLDGGYEEKRELWLCSDKRYLLMEERTAAGGMSRIQEQKLGKWSVENTHLLLHGDDGLDQLIGITFQDKALLFDSYRSYELANHLCK
ncbi:hypothetical protein KKE54_07225, partial [bacterium]|nr:hypothetical protein [bacterium]